MSNASATILDLENASLGPFRIYEPSKRTEDEMLRWSARCNFHFEYSHLVAQYIVHPIRKRRQFDKNIRHLDR